MNRGAATPTIAMMLGLLVCLTSFGAEETGEEAFAGLSIEDLMKINISVASLSEESILDVPSMVTIIDRQMIQEYNFQSVAEALNLVTGMSVLRTYLKRDLPTARGVLQDHYANKVLILINDVPTWMAVTGEGELQRIDINDVERIEVLKGPASVLYGTNAYAGAVNIVLRDSPDTRPALQMGVAENSGFRAGGHYVGDLGFKLFVSANAVNDIGQDIEFIDEGGNAGYVDQFVNTTNFTGEIASEHHSVLINAYAVDESYLGVTPNFSAGAGKNHLLEGVLANYTFSSAIGTSIDLDAGVTYDLNTRDLSRSADDVVRASIEGSRIQVFGKAVFDLSEHWGLEAGVDLERRESKEYRNYDKLTGETLADNNMKGRDVDEYSGFVQLGYTSPRFHIVLGSRYTDNELFGGDLSSRATVVYKLGSNSSLKLNAGQSYRVPSIFELYFQTPTNTVWGNTDLTPERNDTVELAYIGSFGKLFFEALVYHADYHDRIFRVRRYPIFVGDPTDTSTIYVNGDTFSADGAEITLRYQQSQGISGFLNYAYTDGDAGDRVEGTDHYNFKYVPAHSIAGGVALKVKKFLVSAVAAYQSSINGPLAPIGSQVTFDLNFGFRQRLQSVSLRHYLSIKNVADDEVEIPEYVRRRINEVPSGYGRRISYNLHLEF